MELLIWLIPLLPFIGFLLNVFVIRREREAGLVASGLVAAAFVVTLIAVAMLAGMPPEERRIVSTAWEWINTGSFRVPFAIMFDPLTAVMALLITGVGALIHVYSIGYMHGDPRVVRYFAYLNLFVTMMLFLVMANNLLLLFLGWEGVGLCSFLLIGFWFERKSASAAAVKAFVVNRIGDAAFILAMLAVFAYFGTLNFYGDGEGGQLGFLERVSDIAGLRIGPDWQPIFVSTAISFLLLIGATGKSAQFPLFVWLPDAMAGPTPVSALIHAATMVTGGVYLMARAEPLFVASFTTQGWVAWIGALTALLAGTAAMAQWDIKRVLAYSTVSQLGFMVAACGMGAYVAAIFHLLTHGIFKALLFLAAGSVIHGTHDTQDMRRMGGLKDAMPITFRTYVIGALALAGIVPFAGFWSKDEILAHGDQSRPDADLRYSLPYLAAHRLLYGPAGCASLLRHAARSQLPSARKPAGNDRAAGSVGGWGNDRRRDQFTSAALVDRLARTGVAREGRRIQSLAGVDRDGWRGRDGLSRLVGVYHQCGQDQNWRQRSGLPLQRRHLGRDGGGVVFRPALPAHGGGWLRAVG